MGGDAKRNITFLANNKRTIESYIRVYVTTRQAKKKHLCYSVGSNCSKSFVSILARSSLGQQEGGVPR